MGILVLLAQIVHQVVTAHDLQDVQWTTDTVQHVAEEISLLFIRLYEAIAESHGFSLFSPAVKTTALVLLVMFWLLRQQGPVYLLSFSTFKAPDSWKVTHDDIQEIMRRQKCFSEESLSCDDDTTINRQQPCLKNQPAATTPQQSTGSDHTQQSTGSDNTKQSTGNDRDTTIYRQRQRDNNLPATTMPQKSTGSDNAATIYRQRPCHNNQTSTTVTQQSTSDDHVSTINRQPP
jgi:hypothetical protein